MVSLVADNRSKLEERGEYVVLANISSGWFAVNPKTWQIRAEQATREGRTGPNLVVYRTTSGELRDHYVIPHAVTESFLTPDTLKLQTNGIYRWNLTLRDGRLHVTHRPGSIDVAEYHGRALLIELIDEPSHPKRHRGDEIGTTVSVMEGIAREATIITRRRNRSLRDAALERSGGFCEACGQNFSEILFGRGMRALQVHHKRQLGLEDDPVETTLEDLAVVCANCHAIIHADPKSALPIEELQRLWAAAQQVGRADG